MTIVEVVDQPDVKLYITDTKHAFALYPDGHLEECGYSDDLIGKPTIPAPSMNMAVSPTTRYAIAFVGEPSHLRAVLYAQR